MDLVAEDLDARLKGRSRKRAGSGEGLKKTAYTPAVAKPSVPPAAAAAAPEPPSASTAPEAGKSCTASGSSIDREANAARPSECTEVKRRRGEAGGLIRRGFLNDEKKAKSRLHRWYPRARDYVEVHLLPAVRPSEPNLLLEMVVLPLLATLATRDLLLRPAQLYIGSKVRL